MAKFSGLIGFGYEAEVSPGVFDLAFIERKYFGEVLRETLERVGGSDILSESKTANSFRIVADAYALTNWFDMKYVIWNGRPWAVKQVELEQRPRMRVRIGGIWNGPTKATSSTGSTPADSG